MSDARQEIYDNLAQYCRGVDRHDFPLIEASYHQDAIDCRGSIERSIPEFLDWVRTAVRKYHTMHFLGNHLAEISGDRAVVETYAMVVHVGRAPGESSFTSGIRYVDYMERSSAKWGVSRRWVVREWFRPDDSRLPTPTERGFVSESPDDRYSHALKLLG